MPKRNAPLVLVDDLPWDAPAGQAIVKRDGDSWRLTFGCPCGCGVHYGASSLGWKWTEDEKGPSITPSLGCYPTGRRATDVGPDGVYHWHGYLRAGVFEEC